MEGTKALTRAPPAGGVKLAATSDILMFVTVVHCSPPLMPVEDSMVKVAPKAPDKVNFGALLVGFKDNARRGNKPTRLAWTGVVPVELVLVPEPVPVPDP